MSMGPIKFRFERPAFSAESECGSLSELIGILQDEGSELVKLFGPDVEVIVSGINPQHSTAIASGTVTTEVSGETTQNRRGRKPRTGPDSANAVAPAPIDVPPSSAPPSAPVNAAPGENGIPAFLDRTAAPPPPPAPPASPTPPAPSAAPPTGVLAGKIADELDRRAKGATDGGQALADWLAACGITIKGATYTEAVDVLRMTADEKLGPIGAQLGVA